MKSAKVLKVLEVLEVLAVPIFVGGSGDQRSEVAVSTWWEVAQVKGVFMAALRDQFGSFV